jgi:hypothetical protein
LVNRPRILDPELARHRQERDPVKLCCQLPGLTPF